MGGTLKELIFGNSFAASLYSSMPSDLPRPTHSAYRFLRKLVASLSEYPERNILDEPTEIWHFSTAEYPTRVQALRAALGILRSTFSVAVVSRFEEYKTIGAEWMPHAGYFEEHRIQVRWLLRHAWILPRKKREESSELKRINADEDPEIANAFYIDEIVWLFNECGVICQVQGNLMDALPLFRNALELNKEIEGNGSSGSQYCRIALNLAIAQIERARLSAARSRLTTVIDSEPQGSNVEAIARGYVGLIYHLRGEFRLATEQYDYALDILRRSSDSRACSIFCRHYGDLLRHHRDFKRGKEFHDEAIAFAELGGHEDLHKKAQLARIRNEYDSNGIAVLQKSLRQLQLIDDYARTMDMPSLTCESLHVRARILSDQGESSLAGKLLQKSIATAKTNGLLLRMNSALTDYGKILKQRNQHAAAERLLLTALELSKKGNVQIQTERIESILR